VDNERWRTDNESMANNFGDRGSGPLNPSKANWIAGVLASSLLLTACASTSSGVDDTVTSFTKLEHEWAQSKVSWVDADLALLTKTCVSLTPSLRRRLDAAGDGNAIAAFDDRKATCESVSQWRTSLAGLQNHALTSTSGDEIERIQGGLAELRETVDSAIQAFPTSAFREANLLHRLPGRTAQSTKPSLRKEAR
jgi:predicted small secreted protein